MMQTPQEQFWMSDFGTHYTQRNRRDWRTRIPFFTDILALTKAKSILEVGCNWGLNLLAIKSIDPSIVVQGVEINQMALQEALDHGLDVFPASAVEVGDLWPESYDLTLTSGLLIHVPGVQLAKSMASIAKASRRYVLAIEYEAEEDEEIPYRGHSERLWKRPFGRMYQDLGLKLIASGNAPAEAFDQCAWWLMEKQ